MTDEETRILNRAIVLVEDQDIREEARSALHRAFKRQCKMEAELTDARAERDLAFTARDNWRRDHDRLQAELARLREMEEPLRTLYRFVMESWYARTVAVPSGVLERTRNALKEKS